MKKTIEISLTDQIQKWIGQYQQANEEGRQMAGLVLAVLMNLVWKTRFTSEQAQVIASRLEDLQREYSATLSQVWAERGDLLVKALESLRQ